MSQHETNYKEFESIVSQTVDVLTQPYTIENLPSLSREGTRSLHEQKIVELEAVLANTSFAHEYALIHLEQVSNDREKEAIYDELERYHETYADTRKALEAVDRDRLIKFEHTLAWQKSAMLRGYCI